MDYELCKKLKDAGLDQELKMGHWICKHELLDPTITEETDNCYGEQLMYRPTLSELIEACGDGFNNLQKVLNVGMVGLDREGFHWSCDIGDEVITGSTPEEAVARLYLALKEKSI